MKRKTILILYLLAALSVYIVEAQVKMQGTPIDLNASKQNPEKTDSVLIQTGDTIVKSLYQKTSIKGFMAPRWDFIYYQYFRMTGVTEGRHDSLKPLHIDQSFFVKVHCDGEGWEFDSAAVRDYTIKFNLYETLYDPLIFDLQYDYEQRIIFVIWETSHEVIKLTFNSEYKIKELQLLDEDPG